MIKLLILLWLLCGAIGCWRDYQGYKARWFASFGKSYWNTHSRKRIIAIHGIFYIIFMLFGPIGLYSIEQNQDKDFPNLWWFNDKKK